MNGLQVSLHQAGPIPLEVEFSCKPGETLALVGPSGSGKSTILRIIAGTRRSASGRIIVNDNFWFNSETFVNRKAHQRKTGLVFQDYALFPHLTAQANLITAMGHVPARERPERARRLLEMVRLSDLGHRYPGDLSGGQKQRVAVARALAREPEVLLLDEPFSAVDRATRQRLYREIADLRRNLDIPVVLVTHDMDEATMLANRMALLHHGKILQTGTPDILARKPVSPGVARLVGHGNVFEGKVLRHAQQTGHTHVEWCGTIVECARRDDIVTGSMVDWLVPDGFIVLHRRDRPSFGERENPVTGRIESLLPSGQMVSISMKPDKDPGRSLRFSLPSHVVRRNGLEPGAEATVSLIADGIHLMPRNNPKTADFPPT